METYSTRGIPPQSKVAYWNDAICDVFTQLETDPYHRGDFDGDLKVASLGRLSFANVLSRPARVRHAKRHVIRSTEQRFFLHLQAKGDLRVCQGAEEAHLREGDFALCDSAAPYELTYRRACNTIVLGIPADMLTAYVPNPERFLGVFMSGRHGIGNILSTMLHSLWRQVETDMPQTLGPRIADNVMDLVATSYSAALGMRPGTAATGVRKLQVTRFIEENLRDPDLSPTMIAAAFGISTRYVHMLFADGEESVSRYIFRRRLEECARQLTDPLWTQETITDIAFAWGFRSTSHFARAFKARFGISPRAFRARNGTVH